MELNENLAEEIFVALSEVIIEKAIDHAQESKTFRNFTDNEKHLLDVTDEFCKTIDSNERFYSTMNRARDFFLGNNY